MSNDGGAKFATGAATSADSTPLRSGPSGLVYAAGENGVIAMSANGGTTWGTLATQTSANLIDVSFASSAVGYALDVKGGLQLTTNGGASWRTLDPGTTVPADAVAALRGNAVLLVGPVGVFRSVAGGRFNAVSGPAVSRAHLSDIDVAGGAAFAFGPRALILSTSGGGRWKAVRGPLTNKKGKSSIVIRSARS